MSSNSNRSYASSIFSLFFRLRATAAGQLHKSIIVVVFVLINCIAPPACHFFSLFFPSFSPISPKSWACRSSKYHRGCGLTGKIRQIATPTSPISHTRLVERHEVDLA